VTSTVDSVPTRDGLLLQERRWPAVGEARGFVLLVHGLAEHTGRYEPASSILAATGLDVVGLDLRGFGGSGGRRAYVESMETWLDDLEDRLSARRTEAVGGKVVLLGHSMGGLLALIYAESARPQPDLLVLSAPALADTLPAWKKTLVRTLGRVVPTVSVANGLDGELLSRDPAVGVDYLADPLNVHRSTTGLGRVLLEGQATAIRDVARLRVPTLVIHGGEDRLIPTSCTEFLASVPGVERRVYPGLRHETLNEPEGPQVAADIAVWIGAHLGGDVP
jgi:alpha-beta hydrolase superfamily lysophospholipase